MCVFANVYISTQSVIVYRVYSIIYVYKASSKAFSVLESVLAWSRSCSCICIAYWRIGLAWFKGLRTRETEIYHFSYTPFQTRVCAFGVKNTPITKIARKDFIWITWNYLKPITIGLHTIIIGLTIDYISVERPIPSTHLHFCILPTFVMCNMVDNARLFAHEYSSTHRIRTPRIGLCFSVSVRWPSNRVETSNLASDCFCCACF